MRTTDKEKERNTMRIFLHYNNNNNNNNNSVEAIKKKRKEEKIQNQINKKKFDKK